MTAECIQVHGGVGFTWDVDCHLLYRRAKQDDVLFGAQGFQRQRLADLSWCWWAAPRESSAWSAG